MTDLYTNLLASENRTKRYTMAQGKVGEWSKREGEEKSKGFMWAMVVVIALVVMYFYGII